MTMFSLFFAAWFLKVTTSKNDVVGSYFLIAYLQKYLLFQKVVIFLWHDFIR